MHAMRGKGTKPRCKPGIKLTAALTDWTQSEKGKLAGLVAVFIREWLRIDFLRAR